MATGIRINAPSVQIAAIVAACGLAVITPTPGRGISVSLVASTEEGCLDCASGSHGGCPEDYHIAWWSGSDPVWKSAGGSHASTCWSGTCESKHGLCDLEGELTPVELTEQLDLALRAADVKLVSEILTKYDRLISVNVARSALQVKGCSGAVFAHLAAPVAVLAAIGTTNEEASVAATASR